MLYIFLRYTGVIHTPKVPTTFFYQQTIYTMSELHFVHVLCWYVSTYNLRLVIYIFQSYIMYNWYIETSIGTYISRLQVVRDIWTCCTVNFKFYWKSNFLLYYIKHCVKISFYRHQQQYLNFFNNTAIHIYLMFIYECFTNAKSATSKTKLIYFCYFLKYIYFF